ncbi:MAG: hypothetical protein LBR89_04430 [Holosporales bacterium]|jgi:hypothetical protein|nr:hypothetical protein [Holosporales bacterium]
MKKTLPFLLCIGICYGCTDAYSRTTTDVTDLFGAVKRDFCVREGTNFRRVSVDTMPFNIDNILRDVGEYLEILEQLNNPNLSKADRKRLTVRKEKIERIYSKTKGRTEFFYSVTVIAISLRATCPASDVEKFRALHTRISNGIERLGETKSGFQRLKNKVALKRRDRPPHEMVDRRGIIAPDLTLDVVRKCYPKGGDPEAFTRDLFIAAVETLRNLVREIIEGNPAIIRMQVLNKQLNQIKLYFGVTRLHDIQLVILQNMVENHDQFNPQQLQMLYDVMRMLNRNEVARLKK